MIQMVESRRFRRVEPGSCREIFLTSRILKEGDTVYVIGNGEMRDDISPDAADAGRLVVRPREQARKELESLLQSMIPFLF